LTHLLLYKDEKNELLEGILFAKETGNAIICIDVLLREASCDTMRQKGFYVTRQKDCALKHFPACVKEHNYALFQLWRKFFSGLVNIEIWKLILG